MSNIVSLQKHKAFKEIETLLPDATDIISVIYFWNRYNSMLASFDLSMFEYENELLRKINMNWR
jgi:hypothetical protein